MRITVLNNAFKVSKLDEFDGKTVAKRPNFDEETLLWGEKLQRRGMGRGKSCWLLVAGRWYQQPVTSNQCTILYPFRIKSIVREMTVSSRSILV